MRSNSAAGPKESGAAITATLPAGDDVPGVQAFRARPGVAIPATKAWVKIGDVEAEAPLEKDAASVTLKVTLPAGPAQFDARFLDDKDGVTGAYYAYVKKL